MKEEQLELDLGDKPANTSNVFEIFSKRPFQPPPAKPDESDPDFIAIGAMERFLEAFNRNDCQGLVLLTWNRLIERGDFNYCMIMPPTEKFDVAGYRFLGGLDLVKAQLIQVIQEIGGHTVETIDGELEDEDDEGDEP